MKNTPLHSRSAKCKSPSIALWALAAIALNLALGNVAHATIVTWDTSTAAGIQDGGGTWSGSNADWTVNGTVLSNWTNGNDAVIGAGGGAGATINVSAPITANSITFGPVSSGSAITLTSGTITVGTSASTTSGQGTIIGNTISGANGLTVTGGGLVALTGSDNYTGTTTVTGGATLRLSNVNALVSSTNVVVNNGSLESTIGGTSLVFANGLGTGAGQISLSGTADFGARTVAALVQIGGSNSVLTWGSTYFNPTVLGFNSFGNLGGTSFPLTFANSLDLNGGSRVINTGVNTVTMTGTLIGGPTAMLTVKGGYFVITGTSTLSGTLAIGASGQLNAVDGVGLSGSANLQIGTGGYYAGSLNRAVGTSGGQVGFGGTSAGFEGNGSSTTVTLTGTSTVGVGAALLPGTLNFNIVGGQAGSVTFNATVDLAGSNLTINHADNGNNTPLTIAANILTSTGTAGVSFTNNNGSSNSVIYITGSNSYNGVTNLSATGGVRVILGGTTGVGSLSGTGGITLGTGGAQFGIATTGTTTINSVISGTAGTFAFPDLSTGNSVVINGTNTGLTGTVIFNAANTYGGNTLIKAGTLQIGNGGTTGALPGTTAVSGSAGSTLAFDLSGSATLSNTVSGAVGVMQAGTGMLTLNGGANQSYTGATTITSGTLRLGDGSNDASIAGSGTINNSATLIFNNANIENYSGKIIGSGSIVKNNTGSQKISGTNTYTGSTTVNAGTLQLGSASALGSTSGVFIGSSGTLNLSNGVTTQTTTLTGSTGSTLTLAGGSVVTGGIGAGGSTLIFGVGNNTADSLVLTSGATPALSGTTTILVSALSGANVTSFTIISSPSGGLEPGGSGAPSFVLGALPSLTQGFITQSGTAIQLTFSAVTTVYWLGGGVGGNSNWNTAAAPGNNFSSDSAGNNPLNAMFGTAQDVIFSATSGTDEGSTNLNGNVTAHSLTVTDTNAVGIASGTSTLTLTGASGVTGINTGSGAGTLTISTNVTFASASTANVTVMNAAGVSISGTIGGSSGLLVNGTGLLTLTGTNNFTGGLTLQSGTTNVNSDPALGGATSGVTFNPGSGSNVVLQFSATGTTASTRSFTFSSGTGIIDTQANVVTIGGTVSGSVGFDKVGAGQLIINGANDVYNGTANISSGTLTIQNPGSLASTGTSTYNIASGAVLELSATNTQSLALAASTDGITITGSGRLLKSGAGTLQLNRNAGAISIAMSAGGIIELAGGLTQNGGLGGNNAANWAGNLGSLQIDGGASLDTWDAVTAVSVDALSGSGTITRTGYGTGADGVTIGVNNGSGTFAGLITNAFGQNNVTKLGSGLEVFTGSNGYSGSTTITGSAGAGTLRITNSAGLGFGGQTYLFNTGQHSATVSGSGTLDISGGITVNEALSLSAGSLINSGSGTTSILDSGIAGITFTTDTTGTTSVTGSFSGGSGSNAAVAAGISSESAPAGTNLYTQMTNAGSGYTPGNAPTVTLTQNAGAIGGTVSAVVSSLALTGTNNTIGGAGNLLINAQISGAGGGFSKVGSGTLTLSGSNIYSGTTTVTQGNLSVTNTAGSATGSAGVIITSASSSLATLSGNGFIAGAVVTSATSASVGVAHLAPGVNVSGANNNFGTQGVLTLSNGLTIGNGTNLDYDLGPSSDLISVTGNLSLGSNIVLNYQSLGGSLVGNTAYDLINFSGSLSGSAALSSWIANGTGPVGTTSTTFAVSGTMITVTFNVAVTTPAVAYWQGAQGASGTGAWNTVTSGSTNFTTDAAGTNNTQVIPGSVTNVKFTANSGTNVNTVLGQDFTINSLEFTGTGSTAATTSVTIGGTNTLTINASGTNGNTAGNGITVDAGSAAHTISSKVALGSSQTWTVSGSALTVSGAVSDGGNAYGLTKSGTGTLILSGSDSYTGATAVNAGALEVDGSLSGSSAVTVGVATLSGTGNIGGSVALTGTSNLSSVGTLTVASLGVTSVGNTISSGTVDAIGGTTLNPNSGLAVNGTLEGAVTTGSGALLSGTGRVTAGVTVGAGGITSPGGTAPGVLTTDLAYNASSTANFNVASSGSAAPQANLSHLYYSQMIVTGTTGQVSLGIGTGVTIGAGTNSTTSQAATAAQILGNGTSNSGVTLQLTISSADYATLLANKTTNYEGKAGNTGLDNYFVFNLGTTLSTGRFTTLDLDVNGVNTMGTIYYSGANDRFVADGVGNTIGDVYIGSQEYALSYTGEFGSNSTIGGNDIVLTAIPEPGTWGMILGGFGMLIGFQRWRKRRVGT